RPPCRCRSRPRCTRSPTCDRRRAGRGRGRRADRRSRGRAACPQCNRLAAMRSPRVLIVLAAALLTASGCKPAEDRDAQAVPAPAPSPAPEASPEPLTTTVNEFFGRGTPTFIVGTPGDDISDRAIAGQVELVRAMFFPTAEVFSDASLDVGAGPSAWPSNPVVYGGSHVNSL